MRHVCSAVVTSITAILLTAPVVLSQGSGQTLSVTNLQLVSEQRLSRTESYVTYRADLVNTGAARPALTATVSSAAPNVTIVPGQANVHFGPVPANGRVTSIDTFTMLVDRSVPFELSQLQWRFDAPVANAGPNQTASVGSTVSLNGSASTNPSGIGQLSYKWSFIARPAGTTARIQNENNVIASLLVDVPGTFVLALTVSNGVGTDTARVTISTTNSPPVANAGPSQTVSLGSVVTLNGSGSSDIDGDPLTYSWSLISVPQGSLAALTGANLVGPTFIADKAGSYIVQLVVNDGKVDSAPATVTITTRNSPPVADAGPNQIVAPGSLVQLNGAGSTDVDGNPLTYSWSLITRPSGSTATLSSQTVVNPVFTADRTGTYVAQLIVNDGTVDSTPATVTVTTTPPQPPTANAGPNQTVTRGSTVTLSGSGTDPQNLPLTLTWSLITRPAGSQATLSHTNIPNPTFVADVPGTYVAQLIVNNGVQNSTPSTVTITTTNSRPVANAGSDRVVIIGTTVTLSGNGSSDADNDDLQYTWSFSSKPAGSSATLSAANVVSPSFVADVAGTYVVQLIVSDGFTSSLPDTVTVVASEKTIILTPDPLALSNAPGTLTVTLSEPAAAGGQLIRFAVLDPNVATLPSEVTIPAGSTGTNVTVSPVSVGSTLVTASASGFRPGTVTIEVSTASLQISIPSTTIGLSRTVDGTVTLSAPAPASGVMVTLTTDPPGIVKLQPASVTIPAGATTGSFTVTGAAEGSALVSATAAGYTSSATTVTVGRLGVILLQSGVTVGPGRSTPIQVSLATPAPVGGVTVALSSSNTSRVTIAPASVVIEQGAMTPATPPEVTGVNFGSAVISASAPGFTGDSQPVVVGASLNLTPSALYVGLNGEENLTLTLSSPAPTGGLVVNLTSNNTTVATVPASVTIQQNQTTALVPVKGVAAGDATVTASASVTGVTSAVANVTVVLFGSVTLPTGISVGLGGSVPLSVGLSSNAPASGVTVTLSLSDSSKASLSATSVNIPGGMNAPATAPTITGLRPGIVNVTASAPGFGSVTRQVQVTASLSFSPATLNVASGATENLTLNLSGPAPAGGLAVTLQSTATGIATVPASVTIPANSTSVSVPVTGVAAGTATIRANAAGVPEATASVTVHSNGAIQLPANVSVTLGQSVAFPITLSQPAPSGGVTVSLSSSDATKVSISPATVAIAAGQTAPATQPQVQGVALGSATINATAPGYAADSEVVRVGAALSFPSGTLNLAPGATQNVTLTLSAPAPGGGLAVALSSSNTAVATVPAAVTIAQGATTASVAITGVSVGSAVITASSSAPNVSSATKSVTVQSLGTIGVPSTLAVGIGGTAALQITLPAAAPSGGVTLSLSSSNSDIASVSPATVTIPAGQTQPSQAPIITGRKPGSANVSVSATGYGTATVTVQVNGTITFTPNTLTVPAGSTQNLTLTLSGPAPTGGIPINLTSTSTGVATVPATVTFAAGATTVSVPVTGVAVGTTTIRAVGQNLAQTTATVTVEPPLDIILPSNLSVAPGESVLFPIALTRPAQNSTIVSLSVSDPSKASFSTTSVLIAAGQTQPAAQPRINGLANGDVTVTASATGLTPASTTVKVGSAMSFSQPVPDILTGTTQNLTLTLSTPAPAGGLIVSLTSSNTGVVTIPPSVSFAGNSTTVSVRATGVAPGTAVIRANAPGYPEASANVTVVSPGSITLPSDVRIHLQDTVSFPVSLSSPARSGGVTITLASSNTSLVTVSTPTVFIPAGATTPDTQPQLTGVNVGNVNITASAPGYATVSKPVAVYATFTWVTPEITINEGSTGSLRLRLSAMAPHASVGVTANLVSSNPAVASVPPTVEFFGDGSDQTGVVVVVRGNSPGTAQIRASGVNIPEVVATVTVTGPLAITTTSLPDGTVGSAYSHTLNAGGGKTPYTWALTSGTLPANLQLNTSTGVISGTPTATASNVQLTFRVTDSSSPQQTATRTLSLTIRQQTAASITATSGTPQSAAVNTAFAARLGATVRDAGGNPVPNVTVTFSAPSSGASGTFAGGVNTAVTNSSGVATSAVFTANATTGSYVVTASAPGVTTPASFSLTNTVGSAASITATAGTPQSAAVNTAFATRLGATVRDAGGNPVPNVTVTFSAPSSGASGTFAGGVNTAVTNASGVATAPVFTANGTPGSYTVSATAPGATTPATFALTNTVGNPASITATGGTPQSAAVNTAFASRLIATVKDAGGNPVPNVTVTFTAPTSGASGSFAGGVNTATTNASGVATSAVFTANANAGSYVVNASAPGVSTPAAFALTNTVGTPASIAATGGTPQSAAINTAFSARLIATVRDAGGNPVPNVTVTFSAPSSGASGTFAGGANTAVTNASGVATSAVFTANSTAGSYAVTATVPGGAAPASWSLTNTPGPAASIAATGGTPQSAAVGTAFATRLSATVRDAGNNPVPGVTVTFTAPASGASGTFAGGANTAVTNASGVATSTTFTANSTVGSYVVSASAPGVGTPAPFALTNTVGAPASIATTGGTPQNTTISTAFASALTAVVRDSGGNPVPNVNVTFTAPATGASGSFAGGSRTRTVATNASGVASSGVFTANATVGSYVVNATVAGVTAPAQFSLTNNAGAAAAITATAGTPQSAVVNTNFATRFGVTVRDASNNPVANVTVTFNAPASGASGTFTGGNTATTNTSGVATAPVFKANTVAGSYTVTASVPGVSTPATFSLTNTAGPAASITATAGTPQSAVVNTEFPNRLTATVRDAHGNPVSGATVTFSAPSSGASATFSGGSSVVTSASGVAVSPPVTANGTAGSYAVTASVPGVSTPATFNLTNTSSGGGGGQIVLSSASVGKGLQMPLTLTLPTPAPAAGVVVRLTSSNASRLVIAGRAVDRGTGQLDIPISPGVSQVGGIYAQALDSTGSVNVTASADGYTTGVGVVTLTPAGFVLAGPNGIGVPSFSVSQGVPSTPLTVYSARLNASNVFAEVQPISPVTGAVTVALSSSTQSVGTILPTIVTISPGDTAASASFNALATGATTLTAAAPSGFTVPASGGNTVVANVTPAGLIPTNATVGHGLQVGAQIRLNGTAPSGGLQVTVTSQDPSRLLLSTSPTVAGSASINLNVPGGLAGTPEFYLQALAGSGTVDYAATASGFGSATGRVTLAPSGFVIGTSEVSLGTPFSTTTGAANTNIFVYPVLLDSSLNAVEFQRVRGGSSVSVPVTSSNTSVGTITTSPVPLAGNAQSGATQFDPAGAGSTTLTVGTPAGFSTPAQFRTLTATVTAPGLRVDSDVLIGRNLQQAATVLIGQAAPAGGLPVTLTSQSANLQLSATETGAGSSSITVTVPAGQLTARFYLQARGDSGTATYTASATGYSNATGTVDLAPSGVIIAGPFGEGFPLLTTLAQGAKDVTVSTVVLQPGTNEPLGRQALAGGSSLAVSLTNSTPSVGSLPNQATIAPGQDTGGVQFVPTAVGQTTLGVTQPATFTLPSRYTSILARVDP